MAQLMPNIYQRFFDANGLPLVGGKLFSYKAGTNVLAATFTDQTAATPNTNPLVLDAGGGASVWISNQGYKFVLTDSLGNIIFTVDNVFLIEPLSITAAQIVNGAIGTNQLVDRAVTTAKIQTGAITTALLASGSVITGSIANGAITLALIDPNIDFSQMANSCELVFKRTNDKSGARLLATPQYPWTAPIQQSNPTTLPTGQPGEAKWSPDGRFLAVAHTTTPFVTIYERTGTTLNKLTNPGTLPAGNANACAWSPNGDFLIVCHAITPFITIYQRDGINFTKITNPGTLPAAAGLSAAFSQNGEFLAVCCDDAANGFNLYNISSTTFTDITVAAGFTSPAGYKGIAAWSNDSQFLALTNGTGAGNFMAIYQRAGTAFTSLSFTQPASKPSALSFSANGGYLIGGFSTAPNFAFQYTIAANVFTGPANPFPGGSPPAGAVVSIAISPNQKTIAIMSATSPYLQVYTGTFAGGWTLSSNPANIPPGPGSSVSFSLSGQWLAMILTSTPYVMTYLTSSALPTTGIFYSGAMADV